MTAESFRFLRLVKRKPIGAVIVVGLVLAYMFATGFMQEFGKQLAGSSPQAATTSIQSSGASSPNVVGNSAEVDIRIGASTEDAVDDGVSRKNH